MTRKHLMSVMMLVLISLVISGCNSNNVAQNVSIPELVAEAEYPETQIFSEYHIDVELIPKEKVINGHEEVVWKNHGEKEVDEIFFYMYPNAFKKDSTFLQEGEKHFAHRYGEMIIAKVIANGQECSFAYVHPDDNNTKDCTVAKIELIEPVQPKESLRMEFDFTVKLPSIIERMGQHKEFYLLAQWYPKIAVYELQGTRGCEEEGWNVHQYHAWGEFYGDFSNYQINITVPTNYAVAACGVPTAYQEDEKCRIYHYMSKSVHDFCWAADTDFVFEERDILIAGKPVRAYIYLQSGQESHMNGCFNAVEGTMTYYSNILGQYPYGNLTVVVPESGAENAGGMEYPTLVVAAESDDDPLTRNLLRTLVHELAHQYFYGMVASNETEEAWLDEGFAWYISDKACFRLFGVPPIVRQDSRLDDYPLNTPSWEFADFERYVATLNRAKQVLSLIEREIGQEKMEQFLCEYVQKYKFKHPCTEDVLNVLEDVTVQQWDDFFNKHVWGTGN